MKFWAHKIIDKIYPNRNKYEYGFATGRDASTCTNTATGTYVSTNASIDVVHGRLI